MAESEKDPNTAIYMLILKEYAFKKAFIKLNNPNHLCCGFKHKEFCGNVISNVKCLKCGKYTPSRRFTMHMEKCLKK